MTTETNIVVDALRCSKCGAAVPLGNGDTTTCAHCGAQTVVPEAHRQLRALREKNASLRADAEHAFAQLDRPPNLVIGILARTFDLSMFAFLLVYGTPVGLVSIFAGLAASNRIAQREHLSENDAPFWVVIVVAAAALLVMVFIPRVMGVYANRRATGRATLVTALAAHLPKMPGGPSTCRSCGAALEFGADATVVRCVYCGTENAVRIRTQLLEQTEKKVRSLSRSIQNAVTSDAVERSRTRTLLLRELGRYVLRTTILAGLFGVEAYTLDQANQNGSSPTIGILAAVALVVVVIFFIFRSATAQDDADERRAGNPAPAWISVVGPIVFWVLLYTASRIF
jgi:predicted RNA-binding Zn-ribbon protein involved in translation (DUF1610 family)